VEDPDLEYDLRYLSDAPPRKPGDLNFVPWQSGFEIWYSSRIAREYQYLVEASAQWLLDQPGVDLVSIEGPELIVVTGSLDDEQQRDLRAWWIERVDEFDRS
jgi:hypothetical protein